MVSRQNELNQSFGLVEYLPLKGGLKNIQYMPVLSVPQQDFFKVQT